MTRRQMMMTGTAAAGATALFALTGAPLATRGEEPLFADDRVMGNADAPVTIIEYSSLTCPHCAKFHAETLPQVKENWIAPGKARIVYRHFPLDGLALRAAMVANCFDDMRYFTFLDALFQGQDLWARAADPVEALQRVAALAGLDEATFQRCVADEEEANAILARRQHAETTYDVGSTPTFIVNGRKVVGAVGYAKFNRILEDVASGS